MSDPKMQMAALVLAKSVDQDHTPEIHDSNTSKDKNTEAYKHFEEVYRAKIEQLLLDIGLIDFSVDCIQHGNKWLNCVYALKYNNDAQEQYILRVPNRPTFRESDGVCEYFEDDAHILSYLADKLSVPRVKAYSVRADNALNKPYMVQTRLPGVSLNKVWDKLSFNHKMALTDQVVELMAKMESIRFATAGYLAAASSLPTSTSDCPVPSVLGVRAFDAQSVPNLVQDHTGPDFKALLRKIFIAWLAVGSSLATPSLRFLLEMIEELDQEGAFKNTLFPVVLHHWDLYPRNIVVENVNNEWKISGVIDWDAALAVPRPLARRAPEWIWHYDCDGSTTSSDSDSCTDNPNTESYSMDNDHDPYLDLSEEQSALKAHFDTKAAAALDGYLEDAYGHGRWLRRVWVFTKYGLASNWYIELAKKLEKDWKARPKAETFHWSRSKVHVERELDSVSSLEPKMRHCLHFDDVS